MLSVQEINRNLKEINELYTKARGQKKPQQYAKLALIEACGWIEECMDDIVKNLMQNKLQMQNNITHYEETITWTHGFEYKKHFRNRLLIGLVGIVHIEKLEARIQNTQIFVDFVSSLTLLKGARNPNAHTHISSQTPNIQAPSLTIGQLKKVQEGLRLYKKELNKVKFK